ncbi:MAG TPA: NUDIX domain-containing protein [Ktedonobacteraceae bacterium]|nr:NUDIX domain-containing protein [Ktedonobacteraceae bacterium]
MNQKEPEEDSQQKLRQTHVVSCFLLRTDMDQPRLLIVQRSQRVGSYNARWAGISGFLETGVTPDEQAYTEIREETALQGEQIRMLKRGKVIEYADASIGRHWYIHPFLFEVLTPGAITLDWEASGMQWIIPSEIQAFETVPKLEEAYRSAANGEEVV